MHGWMDGVKKEIKIQAAERKKNNKITCQTFGIWDEEVIYIILKDRTCLC